MNKSEIKQLNELMNKFAQEHADLCKSDKTLWDSLERICAFINAEHLYQDNVFYGVYKLETDDKKELVLSDMEDIFLTLAEARKWLFHTYNAMEINKDIFPIAYVETELFGMKYISAHIFQYTNQEKKIIIGIKPFHIEK